MLLKALCVFFIWQSEEKRKMNRKKGIDAKRSGNNINQEAQTSQMKEEIGEIEGEDTTKYGEFVSSYFAWLTPEDQKRQAGRMEEMTKEENSKH